MKKRVKEEVSIVVVRFFYVLFFIIFYPLYFINKMDYKRKIKKNPCYNSWYVRLAERFPFIYDLGTFFLNYPVFSGVYKILPPLKGRVLQVGCGTGLLNRYLKNNKCIKWVNLDINSNALLYGVKKKRINNYLATGIYQVPIEDEYFDMIVFARCFHHIRNHRKAFRECNRLLKKGGQILVTDPLILKEVQTMKHISGGYMVNSSIDGVIWRFTETSFREHLIKSIPENLEIKYIQCERQIHMSNYNLKYPQTDVIAVIQKI